MTKKIVVARLVGGQTVIGKLLPHDSIVILEDPMELFAAPAGGALRISMIPFGSLFGALPPVDQLDITNLELVPQIEAPQGMADEYIKLTSGIEVARSSKLQLVQP